jgi:hypothetical protein
MAKQLTSNVIVGGKWYGPDYPQNKITDEVLRQITNPAAFEEPTVGEPVNGDVTNVVAGVPGEAPEAPPAPPAAPAGGDGSEVPDGTVEDVLDWVGDDRDRAQDALAAEQSKPTPRVTLVEALEDQLTK